MTALSLVLGWLALAGLGNAIVWNLTAVQQLAAQLPSERSLPLGGAVFTFFMLAYGASAATACLAIWRMRPWARHAYAAWCSALFASGVWMASHSFAPSATTGLLFAIGMTVFAALPYRYIARHTAHRR